MLVYMLGNVYWYSKKSSSPAVILDRPVRVQVAVVGAGMAGLSCADNLRKAGYSVAVIERDFAGAGASGKTSGFITPDSEIELGSLLSSYGPEKARHIWEFVLSGVELIRHNISDYQIDCDFEVQDSLFIANTSSGWKHIQEEYHARATLDYKSTLYNAEDVKQVIGSPYYKGAVRYPETFGINSYLYCQAMRDMLVREGVHVFEDTSVTHIRPGEIKTPRGVVSADKIVVCADRFIPDLGFLKKEIYHVQTFLGISKPLSYDHLKQIFPESAMMTWDTDLVYNYFRIADKNRILIGGGDVFYTYAHSISHNVARFKRRLTAYMKKKFPHVPLELEYIWPGMLGVTKDLLPIMGPSADSEDIWYVGAATGLPWAAVLGTYAAEHIVSDRNDFDAEFSWKRKFLINSRIQSLLKNPATYAISHGLAKYG